VVLLLAVGARASEETLHTFHAMKGHVERRIFKGALDGIDWDALCRRYRPLADRAKPGLELHGVLNRLLAELKVSHAAVLEAEVYGRLWSEVFGKPAPTWGFMLEETVPGRLFVRTLYEGGPAAEAGVLFGDRVVKIEGEDALRSKRLLPAGYDAISPGPRKLVVSTAPEVDDSPYVPCDDGAVDVRADETFRMYVMYLPPGDDSRWVPIAYWKWTWKGKAVYDEGAWSLEDGSGDQTLNYVAYTDAHPTWNDRYDPNAGWVIDGP